MKSTRKFTYKELDQEGLETLETIAKAHNFNRWMAEMVRQYMIPGRILEVGSGIGNISREFLEAGADLTVSDIRENYCGYLEEHLATYESLRDVVQLDLVHPQFEQVYADYLGSFDNLFALNVIEHIEDDTQALVNCKKLLKSGGRMVILVPAYQALYNGFDEELFHFRRYTRSSMSRVFEAAQVPVLKRFHFNFMGIFGWFVSGNLLKKRTIPSGQMGLYNKLVPIFRLIDKIVLQQVGLSVVVVGENN